MEKSQEWWNSLDEFDKSHLIKYYYNEGFVPNEHSIFCIYIWVQEAQKQFELDMKEDGFPI